MKNALLLTEKETIFIKENRQDPVTGDAFLVGNEIVFCASCKSAFLKESWEYMNSKHCGQTATLKKFPISATLKLSKPIVYNFKTAESGNRILAYFIDSLIAFILGTILYFIILLFMNDYGYTIFNPFPFILGSFYMLFRDVIGIKSSLGKRLLGLYFINLKTKEKASSLVLCFRNLIYWFFLFAAISIITISELLIDGNGAVAILLGFCLVIANISHVILSLVNENNIFDKMLKIELVEKK